MTDECALIVPLNPYIASKASGQHLSLCTAYNRFFRRSVNSCLFPMANLYSNWFFKTILSPFRAISNVFGFSTLSIPALNSQATCFENECCAPRNIYIHLSILKTASIPQTFAGTSIFCSSICMSFPALHHWSYTCRCAYWFHIPL